MALSAGVDSELDVPFGTDHILVTWHRAVFGHRRPCLRVELRVPDVINAVTFKARRPRCRVEHDLAGPNPLGLCSEWRGVPAGVPNDDGLLLLHPVHLTGRFGTGRVDGVLLVDRTHRDPVVVLGRHVLRRADGICERDLESRDCLVVPRLWNLDRAVPLLFRGADRKSGEKRRENEESVKVHTASSLQSSRGPSTLLLPTSENARQISSLFAGRAGG